MLFVTDAMGNPHPGDVAPDFDLVDQDGKHVTLASLKGSWVVLAFVTSWCPFSKAEQPNLAKLAADYTPKGVKVVAIDVAEKDADYATYMARVQMPIPILHDTDGAVSKSYAPPKAMPEFTDRTKVVVTSNLIINPEGKIVLFGLADLMNFDAEYTIVRKKLDEVVAHSGTKG